MALWHAERDLRGMGEEHLANIIAGVRGKLGKDLPLHGPTAEATLQAEPRIEQSPVVDLRLQTYELLSMVREPSTEEQEALKAHGIVFLSADTRTYAQVVAGDPSHFWKDELAYANERPMLEGYKLPVATTFGVSLTELAIPGSFGQPMKAQLKMIEARSQVLQQEFPDARAIMLPVTAYAQGDQAYKQTTGEVLFANFFARGLDILSEAYAASAGRDDPSLQFCVNEWSADNGHDYGGAVPAVVFVKNQELVS